MCSIKNTLQTRTIVKSLDDGTVSFLNRMHQNDYLAYLSRFLGLQFNILMRNFNKRNLDKQSHWKNHTKCYASISTLQPLGTCLVEKLFMVVDMFEASEVLIILKFHESRYFVKMLISQKIQYLVVLKWKFLLRF